MRICALKSRRRARLAIVSSKQRAASAAGPRRVGISEHATLKFKGTAAHAEQIAELQGPGGFDPLAVDVHLAAADGLRRERARLKQPRTPQPAVDAQARRAGAAENSGTVSRSAAMVPRRSRAMSIIAATHTPSPLGGTDPVDSSFLTRLEQQLQGLREQGLYKAERVLSSPQGSVVRTGEREVINLCANNYLGLANHPAMREAAHAAIDRYGYGMASVRFICGTQSVHRELEERLAQFLGTEDAILYSSCFDANGGLFETLLDEQDAVISDALNHASLIDGIRLCKAHRYRYANSDMQELETRLLEAHAARTRLIVTDGVFSMDGTIANLRTICALADRYDALVMVDDSHATGFMGENGRGTPEHCGVAGRIDILTGTLGKALGGASGGYTAARRAVIEWLRQRSRPYLFSNSIAPVVAAVSLRVLDLIEHSAVLRAQLSDNARHFRVALERLGFTLKPGEHPIIPVMLGDAALATRMADRLLEHGVYVIGFSFPVVPKGEARIRTQMSAALSRAELDRAIAAFSSVGRELSVIA